MGDHERFTLLPEQIRVLFLLAVYSGLRKGELLALEWNDIDFEASKVTVSKACSYVNGQQITKCPKSDAGNRKIKIPRFLTTRILAMMNERQEYIRMLGDRWEGANWLFIQEDGKQMSYFTPNQTMTKIIDRYNTSHEDQLPHIGYEKSVYACFASAFSSSLDAFRSFSGIPRVSMFSSVDASSQIVDKSENACLFSEKQSQKVRKTPGFDVKPGVLVELVT